MTTLNLMQDPSRPGNRRSPNHLTNKTIASSSPTPANNQSDLPSTTPRKQKQRREAGVPKFYDSSTDDGGGGFTSSLGGGSRVGKTKRKESTPSSEHQLSPVGVVNQLPLLPEHTLNHEKLIVQSVEKMQPGKKFFL